MNKTFDSSSPWDPTGHHQNEAANAKSFWKENLKDKLFIVLPCSVALSFMLGYFIAQQQEARKREQWAEILFRQAKNWLSESARSAAEHAAGKGAEYSRRLNPFRQELRRRFFSIL